MSSEPLHIAHVVAGVAVGGLRRHVCDLARAQLDAGHRVTIVAQSGLLEGVDERADRRAARMELGRRDPRAIVALGRALREARPSIVHAHASKGARMVRSLRWLRLGPCCPSVVTVHGLKADARPYTGHDALIAVSPAAGERLGRPDAHVIPNGICPPELPGGAGRERTLRECGFDGARPIAVAAGRLARVKGYDILLGAWQGLEADLAIAGEGPERGALEKQARAMGLDDRVRFLGWREDVPALVAGADALVFSSRREGFPYTLVEALHVGTPVIATRVGALGTMLPEEVVAEAEDESSLHSVLKTWLCGGRGLRDEFAPLFDTARSEYTLERMAERTLAVYRGALERKSA